MSIMSIEVTRSDPVEDIARLLPAKVLQQQFRRSISALMYSDVISHFQSEKDSDGKTWDRWKNPNPPPRRVPRRPTRKGGSKMLQDTGRLRNSLVPFVRNDVSGVRTDVDYAVYHNEGTRNMPAREFLYLSDKVVDMIENDIEKAVRRALG